MAKIYAPNKAYKGVSATVQFADGVGHSDDPHLLAWFQSHGYTVEADAPAALTKEEKAAAAKAAKEAKAAEEAAAAEAKAAEEAAAAGQPEQQ